MVTIRTPASQLDSSIAPIEARSRAPEIRPIPVDLHTYFRRPSPKLTGPRLSNGPAPLTRIGALEYRRGVINARLETLISKGVPLILAHSKVMIADDDLLSSVLRCVPYLAHPFAPVPQLPEVRARQRTGLRSTFAAADWALMPWHTRDGAHVDRSISIAMFLWLHDVVGSLSAW